MHKYYLQKLPCVLIGTLELNAHTNILLCFSLNAAYIFLHFLLISVVYINLNFFSCFYLRYFFKHFLLPSVVCCSVRVGKKAYAISSMHTYTYTIYMYIYICIYIYFSCKIFFISILLYVFYSNFFYVLFFCFCICKIEA